MYYPSTRLFSVLELLQAHPQLTGAELAAKLDVDGRTVRRYVNRLQELGIPIETTKGRYGGYKLDQKFKLPPLVFQSDEILAVTLGLLFTSRLHLAGIQDSSERAMRKIEQVMPKRLVEQMKVLNQVVQMEPQDDWYDLSAEIIFNVSQAVHDQNSIWIQYGDRSKQTTSRKVDPYGLVFMLGMWYLVGYCHLRLDLRTFRVDRIQSAKVMMAEFEKPSDFDATRIVEDAIARTPNIWTIDLLFQGTVEEVRTKLPKAVATYQIQTDGVLVSIKSPNLDQMARFILGLEGDFKVVGPIEMKQALIRMIEKSTRLIDSLSL